MSKDATPVAESVGQVEVQTIETVTGDFLQEPGDPFYRIAIDGFCADFDHREAAENFADAIARHRLAAYEAGRAEGVRAAAEVADADAATSIPLMRGLGTSANIETGRHRAGAEIATAIRALSKEPAK